jgi:hypothetical protein
MPKLETFNTLNMKNINLFSNQMKSTAWVFLLFASSIFLAVHYSCKDEPLTPDHGLLLASRDGGEGHLELLGISCLPDSILEVCDSIPTTDSLLITLADYPGCSFFVEFEYYQCGDSNYAFIHIGNYSIISHNCSGFESSFNNVYVVGGSVLAAFVENFDHDICAKIKIGLANSLIPHGAYPCEHGYLTLLSHIRVSCYKWCYYGIGPTAGSFKIACGSDCCSERTRACRDEGGNLILTTSYETDYPPHCADPIIFNTGLPPARCTSESECDFNCPE